MLERSSTVLLTPDGAGLGVWVEFATPVGPATTVTLRGPGGIVASLTAGAEGEFELLRDFADVAEMSRAFPDGDYSITVAGGGTVSTTPFTLANTSGGVPGRITNFQELQSWPNGTPTPIWQPIEGAGPGDLVSVSVEGADGRSLYDSGMGTSAYATSLVIRGVLPPGEALTGSINFFRLVTSGANNGATVIIAGGGFSQTFPMRYVPAGPVIRQQPISRVLATGETADFIAIVEGDGMSYQLKKDGVTVPGALPSVSTGAATWVSFSVPIRSANDGGVYTIEVSNAAGVNVSDPAMIVVTPQLAVSTLAGTPGAAGSSDGASAAASFRNPTDLASDGSGNFYVADSSNHTIRRISAAGAVTTFAGVAGQSGATDGSSTVARFNTPSGLAFDAAGNLYVADGGNHTVRRISAAGVVTTIAGSAGLPGSADGSGAAARFKYPRDVVVDPAGNVYVADSENFLLRRISPSGVVSTVAGVAGRSDAADGVGAQARFGRLASLAIDASGNLYVADSWGVRRVTPAGAVTTITAMGTPTALDVGTGRGGSQAAFMDLWGIALAPNGDLYLATTTEIRRLTNGGILVTLAGGGWGFADGTGTRASFSGAGGLVVDANGTVWVADAGNHAIRRGTPVTGSSDPGITLTSLPRAQNVAPGASVAFSVAATGPGLSYQWQKDGVGIRGANGATLLVNNPAPADVGRYTVLVGNGAGAVLSPAATLAFSPTPDVGRIINLSIRALAGTDAQTMIVGMVVGGSGATTTRPVLVRAVGPTLADFGVPNVLYDPALTLMHDQQALARNEDWGGSSKMADTFASVGAFSLPAGSKDAAVTFDLNGSYTAHVSATNAVGGVALAEVYDLAASTPPAPGAPRLINVSARTLVGTGDDILIAGFVVGGSTNKTLLIRAVGPGLGAYGVHGYLEDPELTVFSGGTVVAQNDNWQGEPALQRAFGNTGAFGLASYSTDAAVLVTLPPGSYTAQVRGVKGTTGVALVEVYDVP